MGGTVQLPSSSLPRFVDEDDKEPSAAGPPEPPRPAPTIYTPRPPSSAATSYPPPAPPTKPADRIAVQTIRVINIVNDEDAAIDESDLHELTDADAEIEEFEELPDEDAALSSEPEAGEGDTGDVDVDVELPEDLEAEAKRPPPPKRPTPPPPKKKKTSPQAPTRKRRPWFEQVFGEDFARASHQLNDHHIKREVDFIEQSLGVAPKGVVLDLACGGGRHTVELATRGYNVVGYDLSVYQLALAGEAAQERGAKINFLQGDMREMAFQEMFDGVFCWNTSFGYFEEEKNMEVAERVFSSLKPG
jgi:hypothetical protein